MQSQYIDYGEQYPMNFPPRAVNGGWFTGEPFAKDATYGNVEVIPDAGYMIHYNLASAKPPTAALYQYPGGIRPGNNFQTMPGTKLNPTYQILVNDAECRTSDTVRCDCPKCKFSKYAYY